MEILPPVFRALFNGAAVTKCPSSRRHSRFGFRCSTSTSAAAFAAASALQSPGVPYSSRSRFDSIAAMQTVTVAERVQPSGSGGVVLGGFGRAELEGHAHRLPHVQHCVRPSRRHLPSANEHAGCFERCLRAPGGRASERAATDSEGRGRAGAGAEEGGWFTYSTSLASCTHCSIRGISCCARG
jgi:hypothetical protein